MEIGERIKERIEANKLSREQFANLVGVDAVTVWRWIKGERNLKENTIKEIAHALNTTSAYLMGETDNPDPDVFKRVSTPSPNETWRDFYERIINHSPELEFWFRKKGMNLSERDYKMLSGIILSFIKSSQEGE